MIRIALCDDNEIQRTILQDFLTDYCNTKNEVSVFSYSDGKELLKDVIQTGHFDIYILDILMPQMNGMEIATTLRAMKDTGDIIFLTASIDYAAISYDVEALYYMIKPIQPEKLVRILDKAVAARRGNDSFELKTKQGSVILKSSDIMYVNAENRCACYYLKDGRKCEGLALRKSFADAVKHLSEKENFAFCGVSCLVNLEYVDVIDNESAMLSDGTQLFFPRSVYGNFKKAWSALRKS